MEAQKDLRLAVLIDADNISYSNIKAMMEEIAKYGTPTFKRIYGDWTKPTLVGWKTVLLENAISPVQQYSYTIGKNSSDSALIIDAMDILYSGRVDGFCIVSSDSDFTRLATRLREAGTNPTEVFLVVTKSVARDHVAQGTAVSPGKTVLVKDIGLADLSERRQHLCVRCVEVGKHVA